MMAKITRSEIEELIVKGTSVGRPHKPRSPDIAETAVRKFLSDEAAQFSVQIKKEK